MGTDRYAYQSRLRRMNPMSKLLLTALVVTICLCCRGLLTGIGTMVLMGALTILWGGVRPGVFFRLLGVPLVFLVLGCVTIIVEGAPAGSDMLVGLTLGQTVWGITAQSLRRGLCMISKALGSISAMYFLALNTPMTDLTLALRRLHVPQLIIELMDLIYRFIFVLWDTAGRIRRAQESRLGYRGFRRSMHSVGTLVSMVFLRAWNKGDKVFSALESRGYTGELRTLAWDYERGTACWYAAAGIALAQLSLYWLEVTCL